MNLRGDREMPFVSTDPSPPDDAPPPIRSARSYPFAVVGILSFLAGLGVGFVLWAGNAPPASPASTTQERFPVSADDDPSLGPPDAAVVMIEFSDFTCPYCRKFQQEIFPALGQAYPDQIRLVYRDYPILSPESHAAAVSAGCAAEQGAFWPYHDALFSAQLGLGREAYLSYARILELDAVRFAECLDGDRAAEEVRADARDAARWGVTGTPTFFINGLRFVGAQPFAQFAAVINAELAR